MDPTISQPTDVTSAKNRSGLAIPATVNTRDADGTTTESRGAAIIRGTPRERVTRNTGDTPKARPIRSAAVEYPASTSAASAFDAADKTDDLRQLSRQEQRLTARFVEIGMNCRAVGHDGDTRAHDAPCVSARQYRRALALPDEQPGDVRDDRCLTAAADAQVTHADDGPLEPLPAGGVRGVPAAPPGGCGAVR